MSIVPADLRQHDAIANTLQHYIDGTRSGKGDDMKPAFHKDATIFGCADYPAHPVDA